MSAVETKVRQCAQQYVQQLLDADVERWPEPRVMYLAIIRRCMFATVPSEWPGIREEVMAAAERIVEEIRR